jgi:colanic acid biosynthesis glycosyl transferase WcaI
MKVLIYHMRYEPDATGTAPLVTQLARDLADQGVKVTVIASLPHYGRTSIHPDYRKFQGFYHRSREQGVEIIRTPVFVPRHSGLIQRALNYLSYNLNSFIAGFLVNKVDVVLAINPPITTTFSAWLISIVHLSPLVVSIQDIWPDCVIQVGKLQNEFLIFSSKLLEIIQYKIAKKVVVLSLGMKENLQRKGVKPEKIEVIENWADSDLVTPLQKENAFYQEQKLRDYFVVLFAGNHGYISALESVVETADLLNAHSEILFLFAGEGSVKGSLVDLAREKGLKNIRFLPTQTTSNWLEMLAASDLGLVTLRKDLAELNVPSKVYTLMSAARPILASVPENSEVAILVQQANCGIISPPEDPARLADMILDFSRDRDQLEVLGKNGRKYLIEYLHRKGQTDKYLNLLRGSIGKETVL